jgi:hypothetical protein
MNESKDGRKDGRKDIRIEGWKNGKRCVRKKLKEVFQLRKEGRMEGWKEGGRGIKKDGREEKETG